MKRTLIVLATAFFLHGTDADARKEILQIWSGTYYGEVRLALPHGHGEWESRNRLEKYVGYWKNGKRHGDGKSEEWLGTFKSTYVGEWRNDKKHGYGTYTWPTRKKYAGEWKHDKQDGRGTFTWGPGNKYVGEYRNGLKNGQGTYVWASGDKYVGKWRNDRRNGLGTYTWANGAKYLGEYRDNQRWEGLQFSSDGALNSTYSKSEKCDGCAATASQLALVRQIDPNQIADAPISQEPTTTEVAESQPTKINQSALELEFWKTIKDSDDPDMFREYVRQFPSGTYVGLAKIKIQKLDSSTISAAQASVPDFDYGRYHALVIGNNRYRHLKPLSTAVNDANAVASLLRSQYQFKVDVLINATRDETVSALSRLRKSITPRDNLLIYYAGHGWLDKEMDEGFWLPVDATDDDQVDWIANDTIMRSVRAMKAKHVMVVADSCFSGTLIRGIKIKERSPDYIKEISQKKARTALTSGGIEPVTDVGGGDHSIFAATFIRILSENDGVLDGHQLFTTLRKRVMMGADQTPEYGDIRKAGHDGGDFLFVRQ